MNRWLTIRRLRGPAFLLLFGVTALLNQWGILSFGRSWPLYLILAGVLALLERAAFREEQVPVPPAPYTQPPYAQPYAGTSIVSQPYPQNTPVEPSGQQGGRS